MDGLVYGWTTYLASIAFDLFNTEESLSPDIESHIMWMLALVTAIMGGWGGGGGSVNIGF